MFDTLTNPVFTNGQTTLQTYSGIYGGSNYWSVYASARIACSEIWIASDERIKTNINYLSKDESLLAIRNIKTITYKYIDQVHNGNTLRYGVLAQNVEKYLPDCVTINNNVKYYFNILNNFIYNTQLNTIGNQNIASTQDEKTEVYSTFNVEHISQSNTSENFTLPQSVERKKIIVKKSESSGGGTGGVSL